MSASNRRIAEQIGTGGTLVYRVHLWPQPAANSIDYLDTDSSTATPRHGNVGGLAVGAPKRAYGFVDARRSGERLSARECAVLALIAKGQSNKRVARTLNITPETVKSHLKRTFIKLGSKTRTEAVVRATELGFLVNPTALPNPSPVKLCADHATNSGCSVTSGPGQSKPETWLK